MELLWVVPLSVVICWFITPIPTMIVVMIVKEIKLKKIPRAGRIRR